MTAPEIITTCLAISILATLFLAHYVFHLKLYVVKCSWHKNIKGWQKHLDFMGFKVGMQNSLSGNVTHSICRQCYSREFAKANPKKISEVKSE